MQNKFSEHCFKLHPLLFARPEKAMQKTGSYSQQVSTFILHNNIWLPIHIKLPNKT